MSLLLTSPNPVMRLIRGILECALGQLGLLGFEFIGLEMEVFYRAAPQRVLQWSLICPLLSSLGPAAEVSLTSSLRTTSCVRAHAQPLRSKLPSLQIGMPVWMVMRVFPPSVFFQARSVRSVRAWGPGKNLLMGLAGLRNLMSEVRESIRTLRIDLVHRRLLRGVGHPSPSPSRPLSLLSLCQCPPSSSLYVCVCLYVRMYWPLQCWILVVFFGFSFTREVHMSTALSLCLPADRITFDGLGPPWTPLKLSLTVGSPCNKVRWPMRRRITNSCVWLLEAFSKAQTETWHRLSIQQGSEALLGVAPAPHPPSRATGVGRQWHQRSARRWPSHPDRRPWDLSKTRTQLSAAGAAASTCGSDTELGSHVHDLAAT